MLHARILFETIFQPKLAAISQSDRSICRCRLRYKQSFLAIALMYHATVTHYIFILIDVFDVDINRQCCSAESEGLRFDSSWGLRIFSSFYTRGKTKNIFLYFFTELKTYHLFCMTLSTLLILAVCRTRVI